MASSRSLRPRTALTVSVLSWGASGRIAQESDRHSDQCRVIGYPELDGSPEVEQRRWALQCDLGGGQIEVQATSLTGRWRLQQGAVEAPEGQIDVAGPQRGPTHLLEPVRGLEIAGRLGGQQMLCGDGHTGPVLGEEARGTGMELGSPRRWDVVVDRPTDEGRGERDGPPGPDQLHLCRLVSRSLGRQRIDLRQLPRH